MFKVFEKVTEEEYMVYAVRIDDDISFLLWTLDDGWFWDKAELYSPVGGRCKK